MYSTYWKKVKTSAKTIVMKVPVRTACLLFKIKAWWPHVIKAPLESSNKVLINGIAKASKGVIPAG